MFLIEQIEQAHGKVKSGADFPKYIQEIKELCVISFETWVVDSHTEYFGDNNFRTKSPAQYAELTISAQVQTELFIKKLREHQQGKTNYYTFCKDCAKAGIEKWIVNLNTMTCIYYDIAENEILVEHIPQP